MINFDNTIESIKSEKGKIPTTSVNPHQGASSLAIDKSGITQSVQKESTEQTREEISMADPLHATDTGPHWYNVTGNVVTSSLITKNLPDFFEALPVHGRPKVKEEIGVFLDQKVKEFVDIKNNEEYDNITEFCNPKFLETGSEVKMSTTLPTTYSCPVMVYNDVDFASNLSTNKKLMLRLEMDKKNLYSHKLKYRKVKLVPPPVDDDITVTIGEPLHPGKDLIFRIRMYRPFRYSSQEKSNSRHSILSSDIVLLGRQPLTALRDRIVCLNEICTSVDVADTPDDLPTTSAKGLFPSGFLFINNVFYVDTRPGCLDHAALIRAWAESRGLGVFPTRDMTTVRLQDLELKLGHPDVYMHQGNCEHLFTFSEVRLLHQTDPLKQSLYPFHTQIAKAQSIYCTTCAEFSTKWIVTDCDKVPFDPAFFCDQCFKLYLYKDGKKTCNFKAYVYKGNEINMHKSFR